MPSNYNNKIPGDIIIKTFIHWTDLRMHGIEPKDLKGYKFAKKLMEIEMNNFRN